MQRPRYPAARLRRLDHLIHEPRRGRRLGPEVLVGVRLGQPLMGERGVGGRAELATVHDSRRRPRAHDPELGLRPGQDEVGPQVPRVHRDVSPAVGLAQDDRHLRHARGRECPHQRRSVTDHARLLLPAAGHEPGRVHHGDQRQAE